MLASAQAGTSRRRWLVLAGATTGWAAAMRGGHAAGPALVAVTAIVEHPALDACRAGIIEELQAQGLVQGNDFTFEFQSAQGQPATAAQIARQFVGERPTVIVPISTPSAQAVVAATRDIPVVFTAVTDPIGAGLVKDVGHPGGNVTGLSDLSPIGQHLDLITKIIPIVRRVGVPYNPGEANSQTLLRLLKEEAKKRGLDIVEAPVNRSADAQAAGRVLAGNVEVIYVPTDNTVVSALEAVLAAALERKTPVFAGDTDTVKRGAIATIGFNYGQIGRQTGAIVARVLKGAKPGDIPVRQAEGTDLVINTDAAQSFGVTVPPEILAQATEIYGD